MSQYAAVAYNLAGPAYIMPTEREEDGSIKEGEPKAKQSAWQCFHKGDPFVGKRPPFGCLVYYKQHGHPLGPNAIPGLFVGWRIEKGLRYRGILHILDYNRAQTGDFDLRNLRTIPEQEVFVPPEPTFPFTEARKTDIHNMKKGKATLIADPPEIFGPLPWDKPTGCLLYTSPSPRDS